jgi:hypothetical protein
VSVPTQDRRRSSPEHRAAYAEAQKSPAAHKPRLITTNSIRPQVHGEGVFGTFNSRIAVIITRAVGTMWAAYLFCLIALVSFPQALQAFLHGDTVTGIQWLSQSFLQLVLLPIIIVGQNVIQAANDARAEADHETLTAVHMLTVEVHTINIAQTEILKRLPGAGSA